MPNKYLLSIGYGIRQQLSEKGQLIGRMIVYSVVIALFSQIFKSVQAPSFQFWYFGMTQVVTLSTFLVAFEIAFDMQKGQIAYFLISPVHYIGYRLVHALGISTVRYTVLILCYLAIELFFYDHFPSRFFIGFISGIAGIFLYTLLSILLGIISFWVKDIRSIVYLNLTATFCFGGLIVPLDDYPPFIRLISFLTPYPWILWWPANQMAGNSLPLYYFFVWLFWSVVLGGLVLFFYRKYVRFVARGEG